MIAHKLIQSIIIIIIIILILKDRIGRLNSIKLTLNLIKHRLNLIKLKHNLINLILNLVSNREVQLLLRVNKLLLIKDLEH